jgi:hypothetical protein
MGHEFIGEREREPRSGRIVKDKSLRDTANLWLTPHCSFFFIIWWMAIKTKEIRAPSPNKEKKNSERRGE